MTEPEKDRVLDAAAATFAAEPEAYCLAAVCERAAVEPADVRAAFGDELDLLDAWYARLVRRVSESAGELDTDAGSTTDDRLASRFFLLLDALEADVDFVRPTFRRHAAAWGTPFREVLARELDNVLAATDVPGVNRWIGRSAPARAAVVEMLVRAVSLWLEDGSPDRARSTALADRLLAFLAGLATDRGLDRGIDLVRYAAGAGYVPFVGRWFRPEDS